MHFSTVNHHPSFMCKQQAGSVWGPSTIRLWRLLIALPSFHFTLHLTFQVLSIIDDIFNPQYRKFDSKHYVLLCTCFSITNNILWNSDLNSFKICPLTSPTATQLPTVYPALDLFWLCSIFTQHSLEERFKFLKYSTRKYCLKPVPFDISK